MKTKIFLLLTLSVLIFQCSTEEKIAKSTLWGVDFSEENTTAFAQGTIEKQNSESKITYVVNEGALRKKEENFYTISFSFENGESLLITVTKKTTDCNFYYPGKETENQLVSAVFNGTQLDLTESSIAIQPNQGENKLHVITNMHTADAAYFNGTLTRVPLLP